MVTAAPAVGGPAEESSSPPPRRHVLRTARLVARLAWTASPLALCSLAVLTLAAGLTAPATAWLQRAVVNSLVAGGLGGAFRWPGGHRGTANAGHVVVLAVILGGVGLTAAVVPHARNYLQARLQRALKLQVLDTMYQTVNAFPGMRRLESPAFSDKIHTVQQVSTPRLSDAVSSLTVGGQSLTSAVSFVSMLAAISPALAALISAVAIPAVAAQVINGRRQADLAWRNSTAQRRQLFYGRLLTDQSAAREVRLFGLGAFFHGRMLAEMRSVDRSQQIMDMRILRTEFLLSVVSATLAAAGLVWVVVQAAAGTLSVGDVGMFALAVLGVQGAISSMVVSIAGGYRSLLLFTHYEDILSVGPDMPLAENPRPLPALRHGIELRDVWFRYEDSHRWVLRGVSMVIPLGVPVALVGLNGAGKSTLTKLLTRLYDPQRGSIHWDGIDIRDVAPADLRRRIGTVSQDYMAYDLSATENIGIGDLARLDDAAAIRRAAEQGGAHETLAALPYGYETMLSRLFTGGTNRQDPESGVMLSGGQWQKVALARMLMRADRDMLILDEASSGLDAESEQALHRRLRLIQAGRASLLISHRLAAVRDAGLIFVLSEGRITECGTHDELMAARGRYHRLFAAQASGYRDAVSAQW